MANKTYLDWLGTQAVVTNLKNYADSKISAAAPDPITKETIEQLFIEPSEAFDSVTPISAEDINAMFSL